MSKLSSFLGWFRVYYCSRRLQNDVSWAAYGHREKFFECWSLFLVYVLPELGPLSADSSVSNRGLSLEPCLSSSPGASRVPAEHRPTTGGATGLKVARSSKPAGNREGDALARCDDDVNESSLPGAHLFSSVFGGQPDRKGLERVSRN